MGGQKSSPHLSVGGKIPGSVPNPLLTCGSRPSCLPGSTQAGETRASAPPGSSGPAGKAACRPWGGQLRRGAELGGAGGPGSQPERPRRRGLGRSAGARRGARPSAAPPRAGARTRAEVSRGSVRTERTSRRGGSAGGVPGDGAARLGKLRPRGGGESPGRASGPREGEPGPGAWAGGDAARTHTRRRSSYKSRPGLLPRAGARGAAFRD